MILRLIGKTFIAAGILILLFLAYQLLGTNLIAEREQQKLAASLDLKLSQVDATPSGNPEPIEAQLPPAPGEGVARMLIPKIDVNWIVVEGVTVPVLKKGPGHFPGTAMPGEKGNTVISGHRTTYGAPFFRLNELEPGDEITLVALTGTYRYRITESKIVQPTDLSVITESHDSRLTLTTCHPRFSAAQRLIIVAELMKPSEEELAA